MTLTYHTQPLSWLVHCYDGNNYFPAVIRNVTAAEIANHLTLTTEHTGIDFGMVVALPFYEQLTEQITVLHEGKFMTVAEIRQTQPEI